MFQELPPIKSRLWLVFAWANTGFNNKNQVMQSVVNEQFDVQTHQSFSGIELFLVKPLGGTQQNQNSSN